MNYTDNNLKNLSDSLMSYSENYNVVILSDCTVENFKVGKTTLVFTDNVIEIPLESEDIISNQIEGKMQALRSVALRFFETYNVTYTYNIEHRNVNNFILSIHFKVVIYS
jgi:hypothetical protein